MAKKPNPTIGHWFYMGKHDVLCQGPIDYISRIDSEGRTAWEGYTEGSNNLLGGSIEVDAGDLYGGDEDGGGIGGSIDILMGGPDQTKSTYLMSRIGEAVPAFKGVVSAVLKQFYVGTSKYPKPMLYRGTRTNVREGGQEQWYVEKAAIVSIGSGTEVHIIDLHGVDNCIGNFGGVDDEPGKVIELSGLAETDSVHVRIAPDPLYSAYSNWANDGEAAGGLAWRPKVNVTTQDGVTTSYNEGYYSSPESAMAAFEPFSLTGSESYRFWLSDGGGSADNRGGVSLQVLVKGHIDMNPAHLIRECDTSRTFGLGADDEEIDHDSFVISADKLFSEGMGMSVLWQRESSVEDFIKEVARHIDAAHFIGLRTGKYTLKLIRDDYNVEALPILDQSNVKRVVKSASTPTHELINTVIATYWDPKTGKTASVQVSNPAAVRQQGRKIPATVHYPGFTSIEIATRAAMRDLRSWSQSSFTYEVEALWLPDELDQGSPAIFNYPSHNAHNMVVRVVKIDMGDGIDNTLKLVLTQDIYSLPDVPVIVGSEGWANPATPPTESPARLVFEAPYYELVKRDGQANIDALLADNSFVGYLAVAAASPSGNSINAQLAVDNSGEYDVVGEMEFCPVAQLVDAVDRQEVIFKIENFNRLGAVDVGSIGQLGDELVSVEAINFEADPIEVTVTRAILDSFPLEHSSGEIIFFWEEFIGGDEVQYAEDEQIGVKVLPSTGSGRLALEDATEDEITFGSRAVRPYLPGNIQINDLLWPTVVSGNIIVGANDRNRLLQTGNTHVGYFDDVDLSPEPGVIYNVLITGEDGITSVEFNDVSLPFNYTNSAELLDFELLDFQSPVPITLNESDGFYTFDEASGVDVYASIGDQDGVLTSESIRSSSGVLDKCLEADGANYLSLPTGSNIFQITDQFTCWFWIYAPSGVDDVYVLSLGGRRSGNSFENEGLYFQVQGGNVAFRVIQGIAYGFNSGDRGIWLADCPIVHDAWNFVVMRRSPTHAYADVFNSLGQSSDSLDFGGTHGLSSWSNRKNLMLAAAGGVDDEIFFQSDPGARIDELGISASLFSDMQIQRLYNNGNAVPYPFTAVSSYRLNSQLTVEFWASQGSTDSRARFNHSVERAGWGFHWGKYWGGI